MTAIEDDPAVRSGDEFSLTITDARLVNVLTGECYPADVGIQGERIRYIGEPGSCGGRGRQTISAHGRFLSPGLIDVHVHIESSMLTPAQFAAAVLPRGTTAVVADPHELANVLGLEGVKYILEASTGLPLDVYVLAPSCVPAVPGLETAGAAFGAREIEEMLSWPRVIGLAEVMDYPGVVAGTARMRSILRIARQREGLIGGHCPQLRGRDLQAYMAAGPDSDHEVTDGGELLEKLRLGMTVEAHASFHSENVSALARVLAGLPLLPPNIAFCIDDLHAATLIEDGHMDRVLRAAVREGISPLVALRLATLQAANRSRLHSMGVIAPGRLANLVLFEDLEEFNPSHVVSRGRLVARDGRLTEEINPPSLPVEDRETIAMGEVPNADWFRLAGAQGEAWVHVIECVQETSLTQFSQRRLSVGGGRIWWEEEPDLCLVAVLERHGRRGSRALGLLGGFGMRQGALASSVAHDSHNVIVVGRDPVDMAVAVREIVGLGGGMVCVCGGQVLASVALPVAGLLSRLRPEELARDLRRITQAVESLGVGGRDALMSITNLALPVIPEARITDLGLVDVNSQVLVPLIAA